MASGSNSTQLAPQGISTSYRYTLAVSYSSGSQDITNNQTYISASCTLSAPYVGWNSTNVTIRLYWHDNKNGDQLLSSGTWSNGGMGYGDRSLSGAKWVKHQDNGTLDGCYAWCKLSANSGNYAPNSLGNLVTNGDRSFPTIPRTTSMSISATSRNLGESITITGSGASSAFTHKLYVLWNGTWNAINTSLGSSVNTSYTIPKSWANNLPSGTQSTCTFSLDTYNGSTKIGNSQKSCTIYVPNTSEFQPSISSVAVSEANSSVSSRFGFYVQNQSKLKFVNTCSGAYSSSISTIKTTINGATYTGSTITTNAISASGTVSYTVTATDSRGRSVSKTGSVSVTAYSTPTLSGEAYRCNSSYTRDDNEGTYGQTKYSYNVTTLSNKNTLTFTIEYRVSGGTWSTLKTISSGYSASNTLFNMGNVLTATNTYEVRLGIKDFFTSTSYYVMTVSPTYTLINFGANGKSIAFGQQSSNNGTMEVNMPISLKTDALNSIFPIGAVYLTFNNNNPANFLGGTWVQFGQGRTLIGQGTNSDGTTSMTFNANAIGGEYKHVLSTAEMPSHIHEVNVGAMGYSGWSERKATSYGAVFLYGSSNYVVPNQTIKYSPVASFTDTNSNGFSQSHNNIEPYIVIFFWRRTA